MAPSRAELIKTQAVHVLYQNEARKHDKFGTETIVNEDVGPMRRVRIDGV